MEFQVLTPSVIRLTDTITGYSQFACGPVDRQQPWMCSGNLNQNVGVDGQWFSASVGFGGIFFFGSGGHQDALDPYSTCLNFLSKTPYECVAPLQPGIYSLDASALGNIQGGANTSTPPFLFVTTAHLEFLTGDFALMHDPMPVSVAAVPEPAVGYLAAAGLTLLACCRRLRA